MPRLYAVRGATSLDDDTREQVLTRTGALLSELMSANGISRDDLVSIMFTATDDVRSEFPAAAARLMGLNGVPLLCAREMDVTSELALPRCVRVLVHFYGQSPPRPVYLHGTERLLSPPDPA